MNLSSVYVDSFQSNVSSLNCNMTDEELAVIKLFLNYPDGLLNIVVISCMVFMCIGIPGNMITIIALAKYEKVRNATAISIMNLSFSDLIFCCFDLSMAASTFYHRSWAHGRLLCRVLAYGRYGLVGVSLSTITMITINRYVMIAHPMLYPKLYRQRYLTLMLLSTWMLPFAILIFTWFEKWGCFGLDVYSGTCNILPDVNGISPKRLLVPIASSLPLLAIIICYARIFYIVRKATRTSPATVFRRTINMEQEDSSSVMVRQSIRNLSAYYAKVNKSKSTLKATFEENNDTKAENEENNLHGIDCPQTAPKFRRHFIRRPMERVKFSLPTRKDRRLGTMIMAIMVSFCICHLPIMIPKMLSNYISYSVPNMIGYIFFCMSTCINPVIYVVMSSEYREAYKNLFKC